jgi:hypothetical protein
MGSVASEARRAALDATGRGGKPESVLPLQSKRRRRVGPLSRALPALHKGWQTISKMSNLQPVRAETTWDFTGLDVWAVSPSHSARYLNSQGG